MCNSRCVGAFLIAKELNVFIWPVGHNRLYVIVVVLRAVDALWLICVSDVIGLQLCSNCSIAGVLGEFPVEPEGCVIYTGRFNNVWAISQFHLLLPSPWTVAYLGDIFYLSRLL